MGRETPGGVADTARDASSSRLIILLLASILALVIVILGQNSGRLRGTGYLSGSDSRLF